MGLKEAVQSAAGSAFSAVGNIKTSATYRSKTSSSAAYAPGTGTVTDAYTDYASVDMTFTGYKANQIDNMAVMPEDEKAIVLQDDLSVTPKRHDLIIRASVLWDIVNFTKDPADAIWIFQIRKL